MTKFRKIVASLSILTVLSSGAYIVNDEYSKVALAIHLDDNTIGVKVKKGTVGDILKSQGVELSSADRVEPSLDTKITKDETIKVFKARSIVIEDGENVSIKQTTYKKVGDILKELNITLGEYDKVSPSLEEEVGTVDTIKITRAEVTKDVTKEEIAFEVKEEKNPNAYVGEVTVISEGKKGEKEIISETIKVNGEVVSEKKSEKVISEPVARVVSVGTLVVQTTQATNNYVAQNSTTQSYSTGIVLSNGNSAGVDGAYAAQQMEARTGVPAGTWEYIIARESNGQVNARNASGASGLFQTMPGWGSTATVEDQINAAVNAYNNQGLSAWGI